MEPLCAKNPVECAIIYAVTDAELNNKIIENEDGSLLYEYVYKILSYIVKNIVYGTVSQINCKRGQKVQTGDVLFILNTSDSTTTKITAPISGKVEFVAAYKTRKVSTGTFLAALSLPTQSVQLPKHDIFRHAHSN